MLCVYKIDLILIRIVSSFILFVVKTCLCVFVRVRLNQFLISSSMPSGSTWLGILSYLVSIALITGTVRLWQPALSWFCDTWMIVVQIV